MYDKKAEAQAERFGILDRLQALEDDLLKIEGVSDIDFDIDNYDEIPQIILIPRYDAGPIGPAYYIAGLNSLPKSVSYAWSTG